MTSLDTIETAVEGEELLDEVRGLVALYKSCLCNRNIRPTAPMEGANKEGEWIIRNYEEARVKPEKRLEVVMKRFHELRGKLVTAQRGDLIRELDSFAVNFESVCLKDLDKYWDGKGRERYKRYTDKIQAGEEDVRL